MMPEPGKNINCESSYLCPVRFRFRDIPYFWLSLGGGLLLLVLLLLVLDKAAGFEYLQLLHTSLLNSLFNGLTWLGDGLTTIFLTLALAAFVSFRHAILLGTGYLSGSAVVQLLKHVIFEDAARPVKWFELQQVALSVPEGLDPHHWSSFPSGHSATAATLFLFLAAWNGSRPVQVACALGALLVAYSRIYLYVHFPEDVLAGLLTGLATMYLSFRCWEGWFVKHQPAWAAKRLLK